MDLQLWYMLTKKNFGSPILAKSSMSLTFINCQNFSAEAGNLKQLDMLLNICSVLSNWPTPSVTRMSTSTASCQCASTWLNCSQFAFLISVTCFSSGRCLTRCRGNDSFLHSSYHASTSATSCSLAFQLACLHLLNVYWSQRFFVGLPARAHITDTMQSLLWLPVAYCIHYKLLWYMLSTLVHHTS